jgi:hypothetical protein
VKIPDYTTLSRRCKKLKIDFKKNIVRSKNEPLRLAIDSTGLSVMRRTGWHSTKYGGMKQITSQDNGCKIHILVDIDTFDILEAEYTQTNVNDYEMLKPLLDKMDNQISDVYGDLAYDTFLARDTIRKRGARQVILIKKTSVSSEKRKKKGCLKYFPETYKERDDVRGCLKSLFLYRIYAFCLRTSPKNYSIAPLCNNFLTCFRLKIIQKINLKNLFRQPLIKYLEYNRINGASDLALAYWKNRLGIINVHWLKHKCQE